MTPVAVIFIVAALILATALSVSEMSRKRLKADLAVAIRRCEIDPLTKIYNRRGLARLLGMVIASATRHDRSVSLMMIDVDNFKSINDGHGHHMGDRVLRLLAEMLMSNTRESDIVARWGGDEMTIVLPETDSVTAAEIAEKISQTVANHDFRLNGDSVQFTISIGVATYPGSAVDIEDLEAKAADAMHVSKEKGKNSITMATSLDTIL